MIEEQEKILEKDFEFGNDDEHKSFAVIGLGWLGDTLLSDGVCKNIKKYDRNAKITFVSLKNFVDIPKLIPEVDEIVVFDKNNEHKGLSGYLKFAKLFKNRKIDVAIVIHPHERSILCAKATGAKKIISLPIKGILNPINILINKKRKYIEKEIRNEYKNYYNSQYLNEIGISTQNYIPAFTLPMSENTDIEKFKLPDKYIVLAPESKKQVKNWDFNNIANFIKNSKTPIVLTGTAKTQKLAKRLAEKGIEFIDLCGKTSILELATIIKKSFATVTIDTGSMHLAYGLGTETICLFYDEKMTKEWLTTDLPNVHLLIGKHNCNKNEIITEKTIDYKDVLKVLETVENKHAQV